MKFGVLLGSTVVRLLRERETAQIRRRRAPAEQDQTLHAFLTAGRSTSLGRDSVIPPPEKTTRYAWLDLLRAMAVLVVMWDHFVGEYLGRTGQTWLPDRMVNVAIFRPLHITQFGGFFGVCLFFLISGYIITRVSTNETASKFAIRRVLRIFPPLAAAVAFVIVGGKMGFSLYSAAAGATWKEALTNVTLVNYLHDSPGHIRGRGVDARDRGHLLQRVATSQSAHPSSTAHPILPALRDRAQSVLHPELTSLDEWLLLVHRVLYLRANLGDWKFILSPREADHQSVDVPRAARGRLRYSFSTELDNFYPQFMSTEQLLPDLGVSGDCDVRRRMARSAA
jgi:hypothetical protein